MLGAHFDRPRLALAYFERSCDLGRADACWQAMLHHRDAGHEAEEGVPRTKACRLDGSYCKRRVITGLTTPTSAFGCTCGPPASAAESLQDADAVFAGTVLRIYNAAVSRPTSASFAVERVWKGADAGEIVVWTEGISAECGYPFVVGQSYLVYGIRHSGAEMPRAGRGALWTSVCSRTKTAEAAKGDRAQLGPGWIPSMRQEIDEQRRFIPWLVALALRTGEFIGGILIGRPRRG